MTPGFGVNEDVQEHCDELDLAMMKGKQQEIKY